MTRKLLLSRSLALAGLPFRQILPLTGSSRPQSVREEVLLGAAHPERCDAVLQALGLDGLADRHPMSLSGGQKQRVVVAAAMLSDKPLILLDEPTSGLDLGSMQQVGQLLQEWKAQGKTLLVITHDEELAANWCDRVIRWDDTEGV
jgi:energy-coupling factor transport system ATP-binding protein